MLGHAHPMEFFEVEKGGSMGKYGRFTDIVVRGCPDSSHMPGLTDINIHNGIALIFSVTPWGEDKSQSRNKRSASTVCESIRPPRFRMPSHRSLEMEHWKVANLDSLFAASIVSGSHLFSAISFK